MAMAAVRAENVYDNSKKLLLQTWEIARGGVH